MLKIAFASENGKFVSQYYGRATQYIILNTHDGKILSKEIRPKAGHVDFIASEPGKPCNGCLHGDESSIYNKHHPMVLNILDCSVMLVRGTVWGAYEGLKSRWIKPVISDIEDIE